MNIPTSDDDLRSRFSSLLGEIQSGLETMGSLVLENLDRPEDLAVIRERDRET